MYRSFRARHTPDAILFDLGDTLWDSEPLDTRRIFRRCARHTYDHLLAVGHDLPPFEHFFRAQFGALRWAYVWSRLRGRDVNGGQVLQRFCQKLRLPCDDASISRLLWVWYTPRYERTSVHPGTLPALARLRDAGIKMAVVSNTLIPGQVLDRHLDDMGLLPFFPVRVYSSEIGFRKPDPRIFRAALRQLNVLPEQAAFVGDRVATDVVGARRLGMTTIIRKPHSRRTTHRVADFVIRQIGEIPDLLPSLRRPDPLPAYAEPVYAEEEDMQPSAF
jgi:putative hydrolase of the HAD superfamily